MARLVLPSGITARMRMAPPQGVDVYKPSGEKIGSIPVPAADRPVHSVRFGGADRRSLYIGFTGGLYTGKAKVAGRTGEL